MKGNSKIIVLINAHRIVDSESSVMYPCQAQHKRAIGSVKRTRKNGNTKLRHLSEHAGDLTKHVF